MADHSSCTARMANDQEGPLPEGRSLLGDLMGPKGPLVVIQTRWSDRVVATRGGCPGRLG